LTKIPPYLVDNLHTQQGLEIDKGKNIHHQSSFLLVKPLLMQFLEMVDHTNNNNNNVLVLVLSFLVIVIIIIGSVVVIGLSRNLYCSRVVVAVAIHTQSNFAEA
jgi:hypothetical protein